MGSEALDSHGTQLKMGDGGGPEVFTAMAELTDIGIPEMSMGVTDASSHDATEAWIDKVAEMLDGGSVPIAGNFVPTNATHQAFLTNFTARTKTNFQLVFPDSGSTTWEFSAYIVKFGGAAPHKGKLTFTAALEITGKPTLVLS